MSASILVATPEMDVSGLSLRATYRLRVGDTVCHELLQASRGLAPRAHPDAAGLRQDLGHLLAVLREIRDLGHYGLQEHLIAAAALRASARLYPHMGEAMGTDTPAASEAHGFRCGPMGGLSDKQRDLLAWATEGPYEAYLEDATRNPLPEEELAACSLEAEWLAEAFGQVGDGGAARACRKVADDLCVAMRAMPAVVKVVGQFETSTDTAESAFKTLWQNAYTARHRSIKNARERSL